MNERILMLALVVAMSAALTFGVWSDLESAPLTPADLVERPAPDVLRHASNAPASDPVDVTVISALDTAAEDAD